MSCRWKTRPISGRNIRQSGGEVHDGGLNGAADMKSMVAAGALAPIVLEALAQLDGELIFRSCDEESGGARTATAGRGGATLSLNCSARDYAVNEGGGSAYQGPHRPTPSTQGEKQHPEQHHGADTRLSAMACRQRDLQSRGSHPPHSDLASARSVCLSRTICGS